MRILGAASVVLVGIAMAACGAPPERAGEAESVGSQGQAVIVKPTTKKPVLHTTSDPSDDPGDPPPTPPPPPPPPCGTDRFVYNDGAVMAAPFNQCLSVQLSTGEWVSGVP